MTYVEFFSKDSIENICASLTVAPATVILVGGDSRKLQRHARRYAGILAGRGIRVDYVCRVVDINDLQNLTDTLTDILEQYDDCCIDVTGGDDLALMAVGIVAERYKERHLQIHRFDIRNNAVIDVDRDGRTVFKAPMPTLSVEEHIRIYGGKLVHAGEKPMASNEWNWTEDFLRDIDAMWEICRRDVRLWNVLAGMLAAAEHLRAADTDPLALRVPASVLDARADRKRELLKTLEALHRAGLLREFVYDAGRVRAVCKNAPIKRCLLKAGQALEMKICKVAMDARDKDGTPIYNDVRNGVMIDWDGAIHRSGEECDTENEIDVMMMHGMVPVFVSCKNGNVNGDELYKLSAVARRFGGKYAKKVLVATALADDNRSADALRQRAKDMGIRVVEPRGTADAELVREVRSFWIQ